ncbi:MAG: hypothetical protein ACNA7U_02205 [Candidatus Izemoplasmataceae bacterium]
MRKTTTVLGVISLMFSIFTFVIFIQYLFESSSSAGWASFGFYLISLVFLIFAILLSIPFMIIGLKLKFKNMRFYLITHLSFLILNVSSLVFVLTG